MVGSLGRSPMSDVRDRPARPPLSAVRRQSAELPARDAGYLSGVSAVRAGSGRKREAKRVTELTDEQLISIAVAGGIAIEPVPREKKSPADYPPVTPSSSSTKQIKQYQ